MIQLVSELPNDYYESEVLPILNQFIDRLIEAGADISIRDNEGKTAFDYASEKESFKGTEILQALAVPSTARSGQTDIFNPEFWQTATVDDVQKLIDQGIDFNARGGYWDHTVFHTAVFTSSPEVIDALIQAGADVNVRTADPPESTDLEGLNLSLPSLMTTPLMAALCCNPNPLVAKTLIDAGALRNLTYDTWTELMYAATGFAWVSQNSQALDIIAQPSAEAEDEEVRQWANNYLNLSLTPTLVEGRYVFQNSSLTLIVDLTLTQDGNFNLITNATPDFEVTGRFTIVDRNTVNVYITNGGDGLSPNGEVINNMKLTFIDRDNIVGDPMIMPLLFSRQ